MKKTMTRKKQAVVATLSSLCVCALAVGYWNRRSEANVEYENGTTIEVGSRTFVRFANSVTYANAVKKCEDEGLVLASVMTSAEVNSILIGHCVWIGLSKTESTGDDWTFTDGTAYPGKDQYIWAGTEADNGEGNCGAIWEQLADEIHNNKCDRSCNYYVCEVPQTGQANVELLAQSDGADNEVELAMPRLLGDSAPFIVEFDAVFSEEQKGGVYLATTDGSAQTTIEYLVDTLYISGVTELNVLVSSKCQGTTTMNHLTGNDFDISFDNLQLVLSLNGVEQVRMTPTDDTQLEFSEGGLRISGVNESVSSVESQCEADSHIALPLPSHLRLAFDAGIVTLTIDDVDIATFKPVTTDGFLGFIAPDGVSFSAEHVLVEPTQ